jgi:hypothetical protein
MAYQHLLTDKCDIFPVKKTDRSLNYGVPSDTAYTFDPTPAQTNVPCYLSQLGQSMLIQEEPNGKFKQRMIAHFLVSIPLNVNDRILHEGLLYEVLSVRKVKNHHIEAELERSELP